MVVGLWACEPLDFGYQEMMKHHTRWCLGFVFCAAISGGLSVTTAAAANRHAVVVGNTADADFLALREAALRGDDRRELLGKIDVRHLQASGGDRADADLGYEFHADACVTVGILEVIDELSQVFD